MRWYICGTLYSVENTVLLTIIGTHEVHVHNVEHLVKKCNDVGKKEQKMNDKMKINN